MKININPIGAAKEETLYDYPDACNGQRHDEDGKPEVVGPRDELRGDVGPDHKEGPMGKIKNTQDAKDKVQARCKQKVACRVSEAIQKKMDKDAGFQEYSISIESSVGSNGNENYPLDGKVFPDDLLILL